MKISKIIKQTIGKKLAALNFTYEHLNKSSQWVLRKQSNPNR